MKIIPLKAAHGDALIVEAEYEEKVFRIVIDGGPEETADTISECLLNLKHIDLLVLTHFDADHITGVLEFFEHFTEAQCVVDYVWANCANIVDFDTDENVAAYKDAYVLSKHLEKLKKQGVIREWSDNVITEKEPVIIGPFQIDILSPTREIQNELLKQYREYIDQNCLEDDPDIDEEVSFGRVLQDATKDLTKLTTEFRYLGTNFMNKSSIAIRIEAEGKTVLLLGDAESKIITDSLERLGATREDPMPINLIKVSHHGSKANISRRLFELIKCSKYLITTNGGKGGAYHPDRQTIACIDAWSRKDDTPITLYFNYPLETIMKRNVGLLKETEKERFTIIEDVNSIAL